MTMRQMMRRHVGVRAEGMILAAAIWGLVGLGAIDTPAMPPAPSLLHLLIPTWIRVALWWVPAVAAVVLAPSDRLSRWGLALLTVPSILQGVSYLWAWLMELVPGPPPGDPRGWVSAAYYALMVAFVLLLAHIPANVRAPLTGSRR